MMFERLSRRSVLGYLARFLPWALCSGSVAQILRAAETGADVQAASALLPSVIRELFPHAGLDDAFYAEMAAALRQQIAADRQVAREVDTALARLAACCGNGGWEHAGHDAHVAAIKGIEQETFFQSLREAALAVVYRDPRVWQHIGYGGNALAQGGYLAHGFDQIDWLPPNQP